MRNLTFSDTADLIPEATGKGDSDATTNLTPGTTGTGRWCSRFRGRGQYVVLLVVLIWGGVWALTRRGAPLASDGRWTNFRRDHSGPKARPADFSCATQCNADFVLTARVRAVDLRGTDATFISRGFCDQKGCDANSVMGPTIRVRPGQKLTIQVRNEFDPKETAHIGPRVPKAPDDWLKYMDPTDGRYAFLRSCGFQFTGHPNTTVTILDHDDTPHRFDHTNLHLHGITVEPHLFHPFKTSQANARMIDIRPQECFCYEFHVHPEQSPGSFWYHTHLHGSTAVQTWSGMA